MCLRSQARQRSKTPHANYVFLQRSIEHTLVGMPENGYPDSSTPSISATLYNRIWSIELEGKIVQVLASLRGTSLDCFSVYSYSYMD